MQTSCHDTDEKSVALEILDSEIIPKLDLMFREKAKAQVRNNQTGRLRIDQLQDGKIVNTAKIIIDDIFSNTSNDT